LGEDNSEAYVSNVVVNKATLIGTTNGVRIKTWQVYYQYLLFIIIIITMKRNNKNMTIINVYISGRTWNGKEHHIPRHHNEKRYKPNNHQPGLLRSC